ncbi:MAG: hypothetical protein AB7N70_27510, partial [Dehalococcoidia bacterium]
VVRGVLVPPVDPQWPPTPSHRVPSYCLVEGQFTPPSRGIGITLMLLILWGFITNWWDRELMNERKSLLIPSWLFTVPGVLTGLFFGVLALIVVITIGIMLVAIMMAIGWADRSVERHRLREDITDAVETWAFREKIRRG